MAQNVADVMWEMLAKAGVKRCYGIVGDALNPVIDALRRNGQVEFIHVRHEEYGGFAAVAEANLTGNPVVVCATAGPGVTHLFNGLMDARKEAAPIIAIAGDNESLDFVNIEQQEAGLIPFGVAFKNPNFAKVAEAMGAKGIRIEEPSDVREGLAAALAHKGGPVVVDVVVDPFALSLPSHVPFHTAKGYTLSFAKQVLSGQMDAVIKTIERNVGLI